MSDIEFNKIFAAILIAGICFMLSDFIADIVIKEDKLKKPAYPIEGVELKTAASASAKKIEKPDPILGLIADANIEAGEKLSRQCAACHSFEKGGPNKIGPNLWDVVNNPKGEKTGFNYSSALMDKGGKWTYSALNQFLWRPGSYIKGTKMNYVGLKKPEKRAAIIAWMRTLADSSPPLPTEEEIAAEKAELSPPDPEEETLEEGSQAPKAKESKEAEADGKQGEPLSDTAL